MIRLSSVDVAALRRLIEERRHIPSTAALHTYVGVRVEHLEQLLDELDERRQGECYFPEETPTAVLPEVPAG